MARNRVSNIRFRPFPEEIPLSRQQTRESEPNDPKCRVLSKRLHDFEDFRQLFGQWNGEFQQLSRGEFRGSIQVLQGRVVRLIQAASNQAILARGTDSDAFATFIPITARNESTVWQGSRSLRRGQLIAKRPEVDYANNNRRGWAIRALLVPKETLERSIAALTGKDLDDVMPSWAGLSPAAEPMARLELAMETLLTRALHHPFWLRTSSGQDQEMECLRHLVDALVDPQFNDARRLAPSARAVLVKRALDLMHQDLSVNLSAVDLCAELGASDRTLRRAFHDTFGMGPLAYQRLLRLHAVRTALKQRDRADTRVADIAHRWGFHRLGAFAEAYCRQFGELPSQTPWRNQRTAPIGGERELP